MYKPNLNVFTYGYRPWQYLINLPYNIKNFFVNIKRAWHRAVSGFCDYDAYDLDSYYTDLFINSLEYFKENLHGAPYEFYNEDKENQIELWENYLNETIVHFRNSKEDINSFDPAKEWNRWFKREKELENWREGEQEIGLKMFARHFRDLWD